MIITIASHVLQEQTTTSPSSNAQLATMVTSTSQHINALQASQIPSQSIQHLLGQAHAHQLLPSGMVRNVFLATCLNIGTMIITIARHAHQEQTMTSPSSNAQLATTETSISQHINVLLLKALNQ